MTSIILATQTRTPFQTGAAMSLILLTPNDASLALKAESSVRSWLINSCPSDHSRRAYTSDINDFAAFLSLLGKTIFEISHKDVVAYLESLKQAKRSPTTISRRLTVIRGVLSALEADDLIPEKTVERIHKLKAPKVSQEGTTVGMSKEEAKRLLDAPDDTARGIRDRALLTTLLYSACRNSAICNVKVGDVVQEYGNWFLRLHEKGNRTVKVPLHPNAVEAIHRWLEISGLINAAPETYLFQPTDRKSEDFINKPLDPRTLLLIIKRHARKAGLTVERLGERGLCVHSCRVTAITNALRAGAKIEDVATLANHKSIQTTMRYRRLMGDEARKAALAISY